MCTVIMSYAALLLQLLLLIVFFLLNNENRKKEKRDKEAHLDKTKEQQEGWKLKWLLIKKLCLHRK